MEREQVREQLLDIEKARQGTFDLREFAAVLAQTVKPIAQPPNSSHIDKFTGNLKELKWWIASIEREFKLHPEYFTDEEKKII